MPKGFELSVGADTRAFASAIKSGLINPLEDAQDVLDDLGKDDSGKSLERSMERAGDATKDSRKEIDKLQETIKDVNKAAKNFGVDGGRDIGDGVKKGTDDAKEGLGEFKDEANSTAREAAASFDGSAESIGDAFQEVAANALAGFGPIGAGAGLLIAAGLGVAFTKITEGKEETEAFKSKVSELGQEFIETGRLGATGMEFVIDQLKELATTTEEGVLTLGDLKDAVDAAGQGENFSKIAQAYAGSTDELDKFVSKNEDYLKQLQDESQAAPQAATGAYEAAIKKALGQEKVVEQLKTAQEAAELAAAQEAAYLAAGGPEMQRKAELIGAIDEEYDEAAGSTQDFINKETGLFDTQAYIDSMTTRAQALEDYENTLATTSLTPEAKAFINSQGIDSASTFLAGYKTATPAQQAELNRIWSEAGRTSSGSFSSSVEAKLASAGFNSNVRLVPNTSELDDAITRRRNQVITVGLKAAILPSGVGVP